MAPDDSIDALLAEVLGQTQARADRDREAKAAFRAEHAPRRTAGKAAGHADRLGRTHHRPAGAPMEKEDSVKAGVIDAWDLWLTQNGLVIRDRIEDAVKDAVATWLDANGEDIFVRLLTEWRADRIHATTPKEINP